MASRPLLPADECCCQDYSLSSAERSNKMCAPATGEAATQSCQISEGSFQPQKEVALASLRDKKLVCRLFVKNETGHNVRWFGLIVKRQRAIVVDYKS